MAHIQKPLLWQSLRAISAPVYAALDEVVRTLMVVSSLTLLESYAGTWVDTTAYKAGQVVYLAGVSYLALIPSVGKAPATESGYWAPLSSIPVPTASRFLGYNSADSGALASGSFTKVAINTEVFDEGLEFDTSTYLFTANETGQYLATACVELSKVTPASGNYIQIDAYKNGSSYGALGYYRLPVASALNPYETGISGSLVVPLAAGDTLGLYIRPNATNWSILASSSSGTTHFGVTRLN